MRTSIVEMGDGRRRTYLEFFFSSRRRHTRFDCDWSSDVCSSDLAKVAAIQGDHTTARALYEESLAIARVGHKLRSEEHTSELQSQSNLVCRLLLEKKKRKQTQIKMTR